MKDENICQSCNQDGAKLVCTAGVKCVAMSNPTLADALELAASRRVTMEEGHHAQHRRLDARWVCVEFNTDAEASTFMQAVRDAQQARWRAEERAPGAAPSQAPSDAQDAARYRWLTKYAHIGECFTDAGTILEVHGCDRQVPDGYLWKQVDEAIDAAMKADYARGVEGRTK
jgi:hypothetical protein